MLEQKHGPGKRIPAAQRYRQRLALGRGQPRGQHPPQHSRRGQHQQQPDRQEIPRLQADDAHHAHRCVGDVHGGHRAHGVDQAERAQPAHAASAQRVGLRGAEHRRRQQHRRCGDADKRNRHILPAEQPQLAEEPVVLIQCAQQNRDVTQRIFQNKQQLRTAVHGGAALAGNRAVVVAQKRAVLLHTEGQRQCTCSGQYGVHGAAETHLPLGFP